MNPISITAVKPGEFRRLGLLVFLGVLLLSIPQAALLPLLDRDEPRFAEASREMVESGNIIVPTFNHAPRYAKPPLIYWCQAISYEVFGQNAFAARLPSLLATAGTALLLFIWGVQLGDKNVGLIAGFAYAFCLQTVQQGRVATADALLIFFMTLTVYAGFQMMLQAHLASREKAAPKHDQNWNKWGVVLTLGFAGGFLAKGPEALLPFVPLMICASPCGKRVLLSFTAILLLALFIVALWAVPAFVMTHGDYWRVGMSEGVGQRMVSGLQGHGASSIIGYLASVPLYVLLFWVSALPWSVLFIIFGRKLFGSQKRSLLEFYLVLNAGIIFLVFSLMVTKLPHYTLPAFPFIALFFARRWIVTGLKPRLPIMLTVGFGVGFALFATVSIPKAMALHDGPSPVGELVRDAEADGALSKQTKLAAVDFQEPNVVWELRRDSGEFVETIPETQVMSFLGEPGPRAVVLSSEVWKRIDASTDSSWKVYETTGLNAAKVWDSSKHAVALVDLVLVVKK